MAKTPWGDDAVDDSAYNDREPDDDDSTLCEQDGHEFNVLDGRCSVCGDHAPAPRRPHPDPAEGA